MNSSLLINTMANENIKIKPTPNYNILDLDKKGLSMEQLNEVALIMKADDPYYDYDNFDDVINELEKDNLIVSVVNKYIADYKKKLDQKKK